MASFASSATTVGARKHAWTNSHPSRWSRSIYLYKGHRGRGEDEEECTGEKK